ncbi:MAG: AzlD domain-containing protein [Acidimicrobiia bacterium]
MSYLWLVLAVAAINFASRISFLARASAKSTTNRFLEVFPVALFVALAARDLIAPAGSIASTPSLAAALGAVIGGLVFRRSILGVVGAGLAFYWIARLLA